MKRMIVLPTFALLLLQASWVMAQPTSVSIEAKLTTGDFISASCNISSTGQFTGSGVLYGVNKANGYTYRYPFVISKGVTGQGKLILTGQMTSGPLVSLSVTVPNGPVAFSYVVNGKTYTMTGVGTVLVK
jgi:hypothetical protein